LLSPNRDGPPPAAALLNESGVLDADEYAAAAAAYGAGDCLTGVVAGEMDGVGVGVGR